MARSTNHAATRGTSRRVAVLVETDDSWGRAVVQGIADYAHKRGPWHLVINPRDHEGRLALPDNWAGDGIVARLTGGRQASQFRATGLPVVNVDTVVGPQNWLGSVITDDAERARLAAAHLRDRGFEQFAYFAPPDARYADARGQEFVKALGRAGHDCRIYRPGYRSGRKISWNEQQRRVSRWLATLPRPLAILTVDAYQGRQLAEICQASGVRVPDEVAILAGDTDELMCGVSSPPLSSISLASQRIGHDAAALLDRMMNGARPPRLPILIKPLGVISRQSTDVLSIDDEQIVQALRFIQAHASQGIIVEDVLRAVPLSRRSLEMQLQKYLGRSPAEEIRRVRLEKARQLLAHSDGSIAEVALACGFANATRLGVAFRKRFAQTPLAFRRQFRV